MQIWWIHWIQNDVEFIDSENMRLQISAWGRIGTPSSSGSTASQTGSAWKISAPSTSAISPYSSLTLSPSLYPPTLTSTISQCSAYSKTQIVSDHARPPRSPDLLAAGKSLPGCSANILHSTRFLCSWACRIHAEDHSRNYPNRRSHPSKTNARARISCRS